MPVPLRSRPVPGWLNVLLVGGTLATLLVLERRRPLRRRVEPQLRHDARNFALASIAAVTVHLVERPVTAPLARLVERRRWGLLKRARLPVWLEVPAAVLLLDYTLYLWHVLTHRVPFLWRFHRAHHVDLDCTTTTALRFHAGELTLSVAWRAGQILLIGTCPLALSLWQMLTLLEIMFHHSNLELPPELERRIAALLVTPCLHGIHHSDVPDETDSNWSSGLTLWDRLHGTFRSDVPQQTLRIGIPDYTTPEQVTLPRVLELPFR